MIKKLRINEGDSRVLICLKGMYLVPMSLLIFYPYEVIKEGRDLVGPFWGPVIEGFKEALLAAKKEEKDD